MYICCLNVTFESSAQLFSIHPRDKQDVAHRLLLSGLQVAYNITSQGRYQTPQITAFFIDIGFHTLKMEFDNAKQAITLTDVTDGFEVRYGYCSV